MWCAGYAPFETLKQDPLFIARSGGVARAAAYLDKAQSRHNTSAMGAWHPFARVDPEECMPGRASIVFMSGNQGGIGSDGKNPGTVCAYECPAPAGQAPDCGFCAGAASFRCSSDSDCPKETCGLQRTLDSRFAFPKKLTWIVGCVPGNDKAVRCVEGTCRSDASDAGSALCTAPDLDGYNADYGIGGDANVDNRGRYISVAPANASTSLRNLAFRAGESGSFLAQSIYGSSYPTAFRLALSRAGDDGYVASLPEILHARTQASFDNDVWASEFTANSDESIVVTPGGRRVVVTIHGGGVFSSPERMDRAFRMDSRSMTGHYAAKISEKEGWDLLNGTLPNRERIKMFTHEQVKAGVALPQRCGVVTDFSVAMQSKRGYRSIAAMRSDPMFIVHAGGVAAAAEYLAMLSKRQQTVGSWPAWSQIDSAQPQMQSRMLHAEAAGGVAAGDGMVWYGRYVAVAPGTEATSLGHLAWQ